MNTFLLTTYGTIFYTKSDYVSSNYLYIFNNYSMEESFSMKNLYNVSSIILQFKNTIVFLLLIDTFYVSIAVIFSSKTINEVVNSISNIVESILVFKDEDL